MKGSVRIRLARFGRKHSPLYNIVVAKAKSGRDKLPIEVLGTYNPVPVPRSMEQIQKGQKPIKDIELDFLRSKYWLGTGAQPTPTVQRLFAKAGLLPQEWNPQQGPGIPERKEVEPLKPARDIDLHERLQ